MDSKTLLDKQDPLRKALTQQTHVDTLHERLGAGGLKELHDMLKSSRMAGMDTVAEMAERQAREFVDIMRGTKPPSSYELGAAANVTPQEIERILGRSGVGIDGAAHAGAEMRTAIASASGVLDRDHFSGAIGLWTDEVKRLAGDRLDHSAGLAYLSSPGVAGLGYIHEQLHSASASALESAVSKAEREARRALELAGAQTGSCESVAGTLLGKCEGLFGTAAQSAIDSEGRLQSCIPEASGMLGQQCFDDLQRSAGIVAMALEKEAEGEEPRYPFEDTSPMVDNQSALRSVCEILTWLAAIPVFALSI